MKANNTNTVKNGKITLFFLKNPVLREFDLVKFAKWRPSVTEARGHVLKTRGFVDDTTPGGETSETEEPLIAKKAGEGE